MKNLEINPTYNTPAVKFNASSGYLLIEGRSIPEDPENFFEKILGWIEQYFEETSVDTEIEFRFEYVNSGSSKYLLELLRRLHKLAQAGKVIKVIWCFETDDESIEDLGEHYKNTVDLPFEIREIDEII